MAFERVCGRSRGKGSLLLALALAVAAPVARANGDPFSGIAQTGGAGIGAFVRAERSPYRGAGTRYDFLPMYLYEGRHFYFHSHSVGAHFGDLGKGDRKSVV